MTDDQRVPVVIRVRPDALRRIDRLATARDTSRSAVIRDLLSSALPPAEREAGLQP